MEREEKALNTSGHRVVIACRVMKLELDAMLANGDTSVEIRYLEQNLHRAPHRMPGEIQAEIDKVADVASEIVLGYGLCSNGTVGVYAPNQELYVPRAHDCVTLLMGSRTDYERAFRENAGTYYLTPGWIREEKDPLGMLRNEYIPRMGEADAEWGIREELKHYTKITLIDTGVAPIEPLRERAMENARYLNKIYEEITGKQDLFRKILYGPYNTEDFFCYPPGDRVKQKPFLI